jgi:hypothetical protein
MVFEREAIDEEARGNEDRAAPNCFESDFRGRILACKVVPCTFDDQIKKRPCNDLAENA